MLTAQAAIQIQAVDAAERKIRRWRCRVHYRRRLGRCELAGHVPASMAAAPTRNRNTAPCKLSERYRSPARLIVMSSSRTATGASSAVLPSSDASQSSHCAHQPMAAHNVRRRAYPRRAKTVPSGVMIDVFGNQVGFRQRERMRGPQVVEEPVPSASASAVRPTRAADAARLQAIGGLPGISGRNSNRVSRSRA